jgi:hypothetical protein
MALFEQGFGAGFAVGFVVAIIAVAVVSGLALQRTDSAGLSHWKLNAETPLRSMWMNVGYW